MKLLTSANAVEESFVELITVDRFEMFPLDVSAKMDVFDDLEDINCFTFRINGEKSSTEYN